MVELQRDITEYIPRNLSYTDFHSNIWPAYTITRNYMENQDHREYRCKHTGNVRVSSSDSSSSMTSNNCMQNGETDPMEACNVREALVPSRAECEAMRTLSIVSDSDTTFSEDYTRMTETSTTSENYDESDFSTPTGSICSDFDELSIDSQLANEMTIEKLIDKVKCHSDSQATDGRPVQMGKYEDNPPEPNSPDQEETPHFDRISSSNSFEDREFDFLRSEPVKRSTSLKTTKTPPGTPTRKKAVRFADALGLDLESVRHVLNLDAPPEIPGSALKDLKVGVEEYKATQGRAQA